MRIGDNLALISLSEEVNFTYAKDLKAYADTLIEQGYTKFIVDFTDTIYMDSSGLGVIIYLQNQVKELEGSISFINVSSNIMRFLSMLKLSEFFNARSKIKLEQEKISANPAKAPEFSNTLKVPPDPKFMSEIRREVKEQLEDYLGQERLFDTVLALGEALGNAFDHGCRDACLANIYVTLTGYDDRMVIEVSDNGKGVEIQDDFLPEPTETRGRGIRLMYMLVDSVEISKKAYGEGTVVKLVTLR